MIFHENRLPADDSHEISYLIFFLKIRKDVAKFVVCCSRDCHLKGVSVPITDEQNTCMIQVLVTFLQLATSIVANSVDTYRLASEKPADLDLHCFPIRVIYIWMKHSKD